MRKQESTELQQVIEFLRKGSGDLPPVTESESDALLLMVARGNKRRFARLKEVMRPKNDVEMAQLVDELWKKYGGPKGLATLMYKQKMAEAELLAAKKR